MTTDWRASSLVDEAFCRPSERTWRRALVNVFVRSLTSDCCSSATTKSCACCSRRSTDRCKASWGTLIRFTAVKFQKNWERHLKINQVWWKYWRTWWYQRASVKRTKIYDELERYITRLHWIQVTAEIVQCMIDPTKNETCRKIAMKKVHARE